MAIDRRSFISLVAGGVVGSLGTPIIWKSLDDVSIWTQNWPWIPTLNYGEENKVPALCKLGSDAYGILIKTIAGKPVAAEGNPDHPLSQGGICPLGAAAVSLLYGPSRIKNPKVKKGDAFEDISWEDAEALLVEKIKAAGSDMAMISGDATGSVTDVLAGLVAKAGSDKTFLMPTEGAAASAGLAMIGGDGQIGYDLENASYILLLGAAALDNWGNVARNGKALTAARERGAKVVYVGPAQNGTAAVADAFVGCIPGTEAALALGLAAVVVKEGRSRAGWPGIAELTAYLNDYAPEKVAAMTGVAAEVIKGLATDLMRAGSPLVVTASASGQGLGATDAAAGLTLNMLLERINVIGGVRILPWAPAVAGAPEKKALMAADVVAYLSGVADGGVNAPALLMVYNANAAYALPNLAKAQAAIDKAGYVVSFSTFMDETTAMADLILPDSYGFERLDDSYSPYGAAQPIYTVAAPVIEPVFSTKPAGDVILAAAAAADLGLGLDTFEDVVKAKAEALGADYDSLTGGTPWVAEDITLQQLTLWATPLTAVTVPAADDKTLALAASSLLKIGGTTVAIPPFNTNTLRFDEMLGKDMYVMVNGATAAKFGMKKDAAVKLATASGECSARVRIFEGVMNDTVVAPLGLGHTAWDDFSKGKGDNVFKLLAAEDQGGVSRVGAVRVSVSKA